MSRILNCFRTLTTALLCLTVVLITAPGEARSAEVPQTREQKLRQAGAAIYQSRCADCHGEKGQGTDDYPIALTGDKSVRELSKLITETMPEGEPELCVADDSDAVAAYIHDAFYSVLAQARNKPATVEFSRLTVRQFDNTVSDLIGTFSWNARVPKEFGLKAEYYNLRSFRKNKLVIERTDPVVDVNFGSAKPEGFPSEPDQEKRRKDDIHDDEEFSIRWRGALIVPETGDYELIVKSENGVRLYLNDNKHALVDAWVSSGQETDHRNRIRLLGGRTYPLRLEFFRYKQKTASIQLKWKRPHRVEEVIPQRFLTVDSAPERFVLTTPFPPDDRSVGYERGTSISKAWQDAVVQASLETSDWVVNHLNQLAKIGSKDDAEKRSEKIRTFCERFVEGAFRRPVSDAEKQTFVAGPLQGVGSDTGVKRVVLLSLMSPQFLYREHGRGHFDSYAMASWLSYALWDSMPDAALLNAAKKNQLKSRDQIASQVHRMQEDPRTRLKLMSFFEQWLRLDRMPEIVKDQEMHAGFDAQLVSDLRTSMELFLEDVLTSESADFRRFFQEDSLYLNDRLAAYYGAKKSSEEPFEKVSNLKETRSGLLTHPLLLSGFAYDQETSPIHRGVFIARSLLGRHLKPPPEAVQPFAPDLHADLTTRARVLLQTSANACQTCHSMINDLGFSLEHFDATGRYRQKDNNQPIVTKGTYLDRKGSEVKFDDSAALAAFLAESPEVQGAFAEQLFQYTIKQPVRAFGENEQATLQKAFANGNYNIHKLLQEIVVSSAISVKEIENQRKTASSKHP